MTTLLRKPWLLSFVGALAVWLVTILATGGASTVGVSQAALTFAAFSVIVGLGQMFVITLGPGNIDLALPATMTLGGTVALKLMAERNGMILPGFAAALAVGAAVGVINYALIKALRIPPIIATLAMSFLVLSAAIATNRGLRIKPPPMLADFSTGYSLGIPNLALVALVLSLGAWLLLNRTVYGRWIAAIGQSLPAARMAGIPVDGTRLATYVLCSVLGCALRFPAGLFFGRCGAEHGE